MLPTQGHYLSIFVIALNQMPHYNLNIFVCLTTFHRKINHQYTKEITRIESEQRLAT